LTLVPLDIMTLNMKQVLKILSISRSTFNRRLKDGTIRCTRTGATGHFDKKLTFTPEDIGLSADQCTARLSGNESLPLPSVANLANHPAPDDQPSSRPATPPKLGDHAPVATVAAPGANLAPPSTFAEVLDAQRVSDLEYAAAYKAGLATDSFGNRYNPNSKPRTGFRSISQQELREMMDKRIMRAAMCVG
jgi:hypothetical protein